VFTENKSLKVVERAVDVISSTVTY